VKVLPATDGAEDPFFSPDGRWLAYVAYARRESAVEGGMTKGDAIRFFGRMNLTRIARGLFQ